MSKYLFDANIFIQSHNLHYHPSYCIGFWDWVVLGHHAELFYSIDKVQKELIKPPNSTDELSALLRNNAIPSSIFLATITDKQVMKNYAQIMTWAYSNSHFNQKAKDDFAQADTADAYLIAMAMTYGFDIVTDERSNPQAKARILIPDAANAFNVRCLTLPMLLRKHAEDNFKLRN